VALGQLERNDDEGGGDSIVCVDGVRRGKKKTRGSASQQRTFAKRSAKARWRTAQKGKKNAKHQKGGAPAPRGGPKEKREKKAVAQPRQQKDAERLTKERKEKNTGRTRRECESTKKER